MSDFYKEEYRRQQDAAPRSNRGAQNRSQARSEGMEAPADCKVGVDWAGVTFRPAEATVDSEKKLRNKVMLAASFALDCDLGDWIALPCGNHGYKLAVLGPGGTRIDFEPEGRFDFHVSMPGKACSLIGERRMRTFLKFADKNGGRATRVDVKVDDYARVASVADVDGHTLRSKGLVSHAQEVMTINLHTTDSAELSGATIYIGSASSRRRLRVYDKNLESHGEINAIRWEMQERKEAAETLLVQLAYGESWPKIIAARLVSFVDFRDLVKVEVEDRDRLPWFAALVAGAEKAMVYLPKAAQTLAEVQDWFKRALGPTLAVIMAGWGGDLGRLDDVLKDGKRRWKPRHKAMLAEAGAAPG